MKVYVNNETVEVSPGMKVRHALVRAGILNEVGETKKVYDAWGNEVGLDGALSEGMELEVK